MSKATLKLALDLATMHHTDEGYDELRSKVRVVAKEALAKQEQGEPVVKKPLVLRKLINGFHERYAIGQDSQGHEILMLPPSEWRHLKHLMIELDTNWKTYTTPQQRTWVGLNWSDLPDEWVGKPAFMEGAKWAESKLKEKNNA